MEKNGQISEINLATTKFTSDVLISFVIQALLQLRGLILLPIIAKTLGAADYGIWSQIAVTLGLLTPLLMLRLETACVRYLGSEKDKKSISKIFFSMLLLIWSIVISVVLLIFLFPDKVSFLLFGDENLVLLINLFAILLFIRVTQTFVLNYYRTFNKIKFYSIVQLIQSLLEIGLMILFVLYMNLGIKGIVLSVIFVESLLTIVLLLNIIKNIGLSIDFKIKKRLLPFLRYCVPLIPIGTLFWVINMSDRYVIAHLLNLNQVGIYSASYSLAGLLMFFIGPISLVLFPTISKLWEQNKIDLIKKYIVESIKYFLFLAIPSAAGIWYLAPFILESLATPEFVTSRLLTLLIAVGYLFLGVYQILYYIIHLKEKTRLLPIIFGVISVFNLGLNFVLIPFYGIIGAAFSTFLSYSLLTIIIAYLSRRLLPLKFDFKNILKSVISTIFMITFLIIFVPKNIYETMILAIIGALIYLGCMIIFKCIGRKEWNFIKPILFNLWQTKNRDIER